MSMTGKRIGLAIGFALSLLVSAPLSAEESFTAQADREQITAEESVSIKFSVTTDGSESASNLSYSAPDFELLNEYTSNYVQSYYENGSFSTKNFQTLTKVLRPLKKGSLKISDITVQLGSRKVRAPDITIQVGASGAGTPPPQGYGGSGIGLRGSSKRESGKSVQVRVELSKSHAYKGEQVIVSYYLYRKVRVFNITADKIPMLNGFLREDLETPVISSNHLDEERVVLDGVAYVRSLLARYAAYPLTEGKLPIDSMSLKFNYFPNRAGENSFDEDDPFTHFFQTLTPRPGQETSQQISLDVIPVPEAGKPLSFTGGVGDFSLSASVDKTQVKANEAVTLTLKVQGHGNLAAIGEPKPKWPENVELYNSKGVANTGRAGVGEKAFEFLLIPRTPGKVTLPSLEMSFFDPAQGRYVTKTTPAFDIQVSEGDAGAQVPPSNSQKSVQEGAAPSAPVHESQEREIRPLKLSPERPENPNIKGHPVWRWMYWAFMIMLGFFLSLVTWDTFKNWKKRAQIEEAVRSKSESKSIRKLKQRAKACQAGAEWSEVVATYEALCGALFDHIDKKFNVGARSLSRKDLKDLLVGENRLSLEAWQKIDQILEFAEAVRFASRAGAVSEQDARQKLPGWISEFQDLQNL